MNENRFQCFGKENSIMKKKISVSFAFALAMLLICSVALAVANQAGILDFAGRYIGSYVPKNAADYVQKGDVCLENEIFTAVIPQTQCYESVEAIEFASVGVRVDRLLIEVKPQEIYATLECTVTDEAAYAKAESGLWFEFIDPNSTETGAWKQQLSSGLTGVGSGSRVSDGKFQQHETLGLNELHETYTVRAYDAWTKERFEAHEFVMKPAE